MDEGSRFRVFDAAEFLDSDEAIAAYVSEALKDANPDRLPATLATVARAQAMTCLAQAAGMEREACTRH